MSPVASSSPPRLPRLQQPVDTNSPSDPVRKFEISPHQNTSLHHYDQDVVRELSIPPQSVHPPATHYPQLHGFNLHSQPEGPSSSYLTSPYPHNVPLDASPSRPRTPPVSETQPSFFAQHGLPASLPPPPRTTFCPPSSYIPPSENQPEANSLVSFFDSILRGSYSQMLSQKSDTSVPSDSAPEPPRAELELSLDDVVQGDYLDTTFEEFLTSPLMQDESPEETPFLPTPGEDPWTSPMVDAGDDSFNLGEMPLFGATVKRPDTADAKPATESLDVLGLLQLYSPAEHSASPTFESSKMDSVTPALDPLDTFDHMYTIPQTPALAAASLYNSPRLPSTLTPSSSEPPRPTKGMPTGTRRNITPAALVPLDAPTQPRQYVTPSATSRKAVPSAFTKGKKRARSEVEADDEPGAEGDVDPNTQEAIEAKRRQNTLAARRSRARKLEHIRELEETVVQITQDRDEWRTRAYDAEAKLRANGLS